MKVEKQLFSFYWIAENLFSIFIEFFAVFSTEFAIESCRFPECFSSIFLSSHELLRSGGNSQPLRCIALARLRRHTPYVACGLIRTMIIFTRWRIFIEDLSRSLDSIRIAQMLREAAWVSEENLFKRCPSLLHILFRTPWAAPGKLFSSRK